MDKNEMIREALKAVIDDMGKVARSNKAKKFARPAKALEMDSAKVSPAPDADESAEGSEVEGGPLAGLMNKPGVGADAGGLSEEELQELLAGAK